jgi:Protein of unknown function (DUF1266)
MTFPARTWALAAPGILTQLNGHDHGLLGGAPPSPEVAQDRAAVLLRDWDAADRAGLLKTLDWLAREGHRKEFNDVCVLDQQVTAKLEPWDTIETAVEDKAVLANIYFARRHRERIGSRSLLAWDMVRLITIAGWGYLTRMISEDEAWSYVLPAAQAIQRTYTSWEELGKHHLLGREFWAGAWEGRFARCCLALFDDPASPWRTLPWAMDLTQHGLMVPLQTIVVEAPPRPQPTAPSLRRGPVDEEGPAPRSRTGRTVGILVAVAVAIAGTGVALAVRHLRHAGSSTTPSSAPAAAPPPGGAPQGPTPSRGAPQPTTKPATKKH